MTHFLSSAGLADCFNDGALLLAVGHRTCDFGLKLQQNGGYNVSLKGLSGHLQQQRVYKVTCTGCEVMTHADVTVTPGEGVNLLL